MILPPRHKSAGGPIRCPGPVEISQPVITSRICTGTRPQLIIAVIAGTGLQIRHCRVGSVDRCSSPASHKREIDEKIDEKIDEPTCSLAARPNCFEIKLESAEKLPVLRNSENPALKQVQSGPPNYVRFGGQPVSLAKVSVGRFAADRPAHTRCEKPKILLNSPPTV